MRWLAEQREVKVLKRKHLPFNLIGADAPCARCTSVGGRALGSTADGGPWGRFHGHQVRHLRPHGGLGRPSRCLNFHIPGCSSFTPSDSLRYPKARPAARAGGLSVALPVALLVGGVRRGPCRMWVGRRQSGPWGSFVTSHRRRASLYLP